MFATSDLVFEITGPWDGHIGAGCDRRLGDESLTHLDPTYCLLLDFLHEAEGLFQSRRWIERGEDCLELLGEEFAS